MAADGTWNLTMNTPMGERRSTLTLSTSGGTLTGKLAGEDGGSVDIQEGKLAGNAASWKANIKNPMPLTLEFRGTVDGDKISGTVSMRFWAWKSWIANLPYCSGWLASNADLSVIFPESSAIARVSALKVEPISNTPVVSRLIRLAKPKLSSKMPQPMAKTSHIPEMPYS